MMFKPLLSTLLLIALVPGAALAQNQTAAVPAASSVAQAPTPPAPSALTTQATLPTAPTVEAPVLPPDAASLSDPLGSTSMREAAKLQALTDLENARAKLDAARFARLLAQQKFTEQMNEAKAKSDEAPEAGLEGNGKDEGPAGAGSVGAGAPSEAVVPVEAKPYATSYYNFDGKQFARVTINGTPTVVSPGDTLPDGTRVLSIDAKRVVLRRHGEKVTVPYLGGGLGFGN